jgi:glutamyl-Q tRNA(Asp) synthetase
MTLRTRFAPSPTGPLHLGHAYSALLAFDMAQAEGGDFLLRVEDIDQSRCRPEWEALIFDDLAWLGLTWPKPVMRQSDRLSVYHAGLQRLWARGLLYECSCNRRDIKDAISAPQEGASPVAGPDGLIYPGTCRSKSRRPDQPMPQEAALRLDMAQAVAVISGTRRDLSFCETGQGPDGQHGRIGLDAKALVKMVGDVVLCRRDMGTSYHLSVVLDDADQGISHVTRGQDLFSATHIHVVLQHLLNLPTPIYHHHRLIRDEQGKRLAKRDDARAIQTYREAGATATDIREMVGLSHRLT